VKGLRETPSSALRPLNVALLTEGCYPFSAGGVSTWCDQLIRGLPENDFHMVAITGDDDAQPQITMPGNVVSLTAVPLWGRARPTVARTARRAGVTPSLHRFLESLVNPDVPQEQFETELRHLATVAPSGWLAFALRTDVVTESLNRLWVRQHGATMSLHEAMSALELLEHSLRPLLLPPIRADICHAVSNGLPSLLALVSKWTYGTPFVMSEHGVYLRERYLAFASLDCSWPVKSILLSFFRRLTYTAYANADVIAPVNVYNQRWEIEHGANPDSIVTAFNGVDAAKYPLAKTEPDVPTVVWVGRIDPLKDLATLIEGFAMVRDVIPDARLRLFGPTPAGNEEYERELRALVEDRRVEDAVVFEGPVSPVAAAYHGAHVVALTSISEGLPYTVIEAMMCGRATVSTEVGGVPEVVGDAGLLVPPGNPARLASALLDVLLDVRLRSRLAVAARDRALSCFQLDRMLDTFRGIYASVSPIAAQSGELRERERALT
jgi:glycosyltransferase involved in cell wall biosynthesis